MRTHHKFRIPNFKRSIKYLIYKVLSNNYMVESGRHDIRQNATRQNDTDQKIASLRTLMSAAV